MPAGYDRGRIPSLLERKQAWIRAALERAEATRKFFEPRSSWRLPMQIHLPAIGRVFQVEARETGAAWVAVRTAEPGIIEVRGRISDERLCRLALTRWLARLTREYLAPRLQTLSAKTELRYNRVFVKQQRTRWAGCSRHRNISLNLKLLFLPPALVDYVLIHELCHLAEMNHSQQFWMMVEKHCPHHRKLDAQLREMWKLVPQWIVSLESGNGSPI